MMMMMNIDYDFFLLQRLIQLEWPKNDDDDDHYHIIIIVVVVKCVCVHLQNFQITMYMGIEIIISFIEWKNWIFTKCPHKKKSFINLKPSDDYRTLNNTATKKTHTHTHARVKCSTTIIVVVCCIVCIELSSSSSTSF